MVPKLPSPRPISTRASVTLKTTAASCQEPSPFGCLIDVRASNQPRETSMVFIGFPANCVVGHTLQVCFEALERLFSDAAGSASSLLTIRLYRVSPPHSVPRVPGAPLPRNILPGRIPFHHVCERAMAATGHLEPAPVITPSSSIRPITPISSPPRCHRPFIRIIIIGSFRESRNERGFGNGQTIQRFVKIVQRRCSDTVRSEPKVYFVEIEFENSIFRQRPFNPESEDRFLYFALHRNIRSK